MIIENPSRDEALIRALVGIWEDSVRETHTFLKLEDVIFLRSTVVTGIKEVDTLLVAYKDKVPIGFLGMTRDKIEMLFLSPFCMGVGIGKKLILEAVHNHKAIYVDVNEQNPHAVKFYRRFGFEVFKRTDSDDMGNPFPILKMRQV